MTFEEILTFVSNEADLIGLPLVFGDTYVQNEAANGILGDFFTLDIVGGMANTVSYAQEPTYSVVIRCVGTSFYMRDDAQEIQTLIRTDAFMRRMLASVICKLEITAPRITKIQNEYDTIKSGWQITFDVVDGALLN